jgi:L,D-transpeptidase ErfK/SrfK
VVLPSQFILPPGPREDLVINLAQLRRFYFPAPKAGVPSWMKSDRMFQKAMRK